MEFLEATDVNQQLEELADLLEVVYSFTRYKGFTVDERGGFYDKIQLVSVH
ncbi:hypothetical protein [Paenibacillus sp. BIHB 4019]|nr:hypothetical protein [Paenibacillus sp. BIHB 4019]